MQRMSLPLKTIDLLYFYFFSFYSTCKLYPIYQTICVGFCSVIDYIVHRLSYFSNVVLKIITYIRYSFTDFFTSEANYRVWIRGNCQFQEKMFFICFLPNIFVEAFRRKKIKRATLEFYKSIREGFCSTISDFPKKN